jgi:hypothetical protein
VTVLDADAVIVGAGSVGSMAAWQLAARGLRVVAIDRFPVPGPFSAYAGETRVSQWLAERPGLPQDEFIDDIPYPETQNYVKRILGTAEDYRRLYGGGLLLPGSLKNAPPQKPVRVTMSKPKPSRKAPVKKASAKKSKSSTSRTNKTR